MRGTPAVQRARSYESLFRQLKAFAREAGLEAMGGWDRHRLGTEVARGMDVRVQHAREASRIAEGVLHLCRGAGLDERVTRRWHPDPEVGLQSDDAAVRRRSSRTAAERGKQAQGEGATAAAEILGPRYPGCIHAGAIRGARQRGGDSKASQVPGTCHGAPSRRSARSLGRRRGAVTPALLLDRPVQP